MKKEYLSWTQIASIKPINDFFLFWPKDLEKLDFVFGPDFIWLESLSAYFYQKPTLIKDYYKTQQFNIEDFASFFINYLKEDNCHNEEQFFIICNRVFDFLYLLGFKNNLQNTLDSYMDLMPETCNVILWTNIGFSFNLRDFFPKELIITLTNNLTDYLHKNFYKKDKCKIIYDEEEQCILLVDENYTSISDRILLENKKDYYEKNNFRQLFIEQINSLKNNYKISYKDMAEKIGCSYNSLIEYKNKPQKYVWSEEKAKENLLKLLKDLEGDIN